MTRRNTSFLNDSLDASMEFDLSACISARSANGVPDDELDSGYVRAKSINFTDVSAAEL
jgi:hypothetical protein